MIKKIGKYDETLLGVDTDSERSEVKTCEIHSWEICDGWGVVIGVSRCRKCGKLARGADFEKRTEANKFEFLKGMSKEIASLRELVRIAFEEGATAIEYEASRCASLPLWAQKRQELWGRSVTRRALEGSKQ